MAPKGFQGTSLLDYPGKIASLIFYGGCNLSCSYCHNPGLISDPDQYPDIAIDDLVDALNERRHFIDAVVVSGGEPTLANDLPVLLRAVKALNLDVKIDTNGLAPQTLKDLAEQGLVDYVALDLKTRPERYSELHHRPVEPEALCETIDFLRQGKLAYEVRTTCVPGLVEKEDVVAMGESIRGIGTWVLQQFIPDHAMAEDMQKRSPHAPEEIRAMADLARAYAKQVQVRGL